MRSAWRREMISMALNQDADQEQESGFVPEVRGVDEAAGSERDRRIEEIAARESQRREGSAAPEIETTPPAADVTATIDGQQVEEETQRADPQVLAGDFAQYKVKAKVDGEELEVSLDEVLRHYQKNGAADKRLAEATRLLREAQEVAKKVEPDVVPEAAKPADVDDTAINDFVESLWDSDKDRAKESLRKFMAGRQQQAPTLDPMKIAEQIAPTIQKQLAVENALEQFREANPDIIDDPYLSSITERFWAEEVSAGKDQVKALKDAGVKTRDWLKSKGIGSGVTVPPTVARDEKLKRKAGIDVLPTTSARAVGSSAEAPQTTQDVIAGMRKARGFQV